jgi:hypothetical protein
MMPEELIGHSVTAAEGGLTIEVAAVVRHKGETYITGKVYLLRGEVPEDIVVI